MTLIKKICLNCIFNEIKIEVAGFGDLRDDNDPNCTYEGENNVLLQQASNWLLSCRKTGYEQFKEVSPIKSAEFLHAYDAIIQRKCNWNTSREALDSQSETYTVFNNCTV